MLVRRHNTPLYRVGKAFGFNRHDIEDLMQETHAAAYTHLPQFKRLSTYKTWLVQIMLNNCRQRLQRKQTKKEELQADLPQAEALFRQGAAKENETSRRILSSELNLILEEAIDLLPPPYRMVFTLRELNGLSIAETAGVLTISETNVKVRLSRAKALLRKQIEKYYSPDDLSEFKQSLCNRMTARVMALVQGMALS